MRTGQSVRTAKSVCTRTSLAGVLALSRYVMGGKPDAILRFVDYEWNEEKAAGNLEKHGVSFVEAATVFDDPLYIDFYDPDHSADEHRYLIIGTSTAGRLLIVSYTERTDVVRLISAREVTSTEREAYEEG